MTPKLATHRQLAAIARVIYDADMTDADWSAAVKARAARQGYAWRPEAITAAIRAVERAHDFVREVPRGPSATQEPIISAPSRDVAAAFMREIERRFEARGGRPARPAPSPSPVARVALALMRDVRREILARRRTG